VYLGLITTLPATYPGKTSLFSVGNSYESRPINVLKIDVGGSPKTKGLWIEGGIHDREWISPATVLCIIDKLLSLYGSDSDVTTILDNFEFYAMPVLNVDGYTYTWINANTRLWRKNRKPSSMSCIGTDLNRNWAKGWGGTGSSGSPCSSTYRGTSAFSEPETEHVSDYMDSKSAGFWKGYINWHSYGQLWLSPWGYTNAATPDATDQNTLGSNCVAAIFAVHSKTYTAGPVYSTIYPASGIAPDWTYDHLGIIYSYGPELRDTGTDGFLLPANQIEDTCEEIWPAFILWALEANTL